MGQSRATIIILYMTCAVIVLLREFDWWRRELAFQASNSIELHFRLSQGIRVTQSNCIISYHNSIILTRKGVCENSGLLKARIGDLVYFVGRWERGMTEGTVTKKDWIIASKVDLIPQEPSPLISPWWWLGKLQSVKDRIVLIYKRYLPEPQASLTAGIVIGDQGDLPDTFKESLQRTGTTHMVAASGYNVSVVASVAMGFFVRVFGRRKGAVATTIFIFIYVLLAGGNPPVVRSGLMGIIMLYGISLGREYWSLWALLLVSLGMLGLQPWLITSVSFQLSLAASVGVIWGAEPISRIIKKGIDRIFSSNITEYRTNNRYRTIWKQTYQLFLDLFSTTCAAVLMTTPISLYTFGSASWWGLVVNPMILWLIPPLMYLGGMMALSGLLWLPLASLFGWLVAPLSLVLVSFIQIAGLFPIGVFTFHINWLVIIGWWLVWVQIWTLLRAYFKK